MKWIIMLALAFCLSALISGCGADELNDALDEFSPPSDDGSPGGKDKKDKKGKK